MNSDSKALRTSQVIRVHRLKLDWPLLVVTLLLCALGLATLYSAAGSPLQDGAPRVFRMQALYIGLGLLTMMAMTLVDPRVFQRLAYVAYVCVLGLLLIVFVVGVVRGGAQRWIPLGPVNLQPSELAKLALVMALARYFSSRPQEQGWGLKELVAPVGLFLVPMGFLVFIEPDLGTCLFLCFVFAAVVFAVGLRWRTVMVVALLAMLAAPMAYQYLLSDYQKQRVEVVLRPDADPMGRGYQSIQGRYAIGSGQVLGKGWGEGTQGRLRFLPEQHTDFVFSVFAEEQGFVGCVFALMLYFGQMLLGLWVAWHARDRFGSILAIGVVAVLFCQVCINLGGVLSMIPVTGVTLPFMSYGGSSVLTLLCGVGMLMSVSAHRRS